MPLAACSTNIVFAPTTCTVKPGGISQIYLFDSTLLDFTQAAPVSGVTQPYTAITDLGTSTKIYGVQFARMQAQYQATQKNATGINAGYEHTLTFPVPDLSMLSTQWSILADNQGYCCGIGLIIIFNSGRIFIMGESSVNGVGLAYPFYTWQDGSKADSGKKADDMNAYTAVIKGEYNRLLIEYTGTLASIIALKP